MECHYVRCQKKARFAGEEERAHVLSADESRARREIVSLFFRFERVRNVKRRRSTMTIMALLLGILSESRSPKTFLYRFLTSLIIRSPSLERRSSSPRRYLKSARRKYSTYSPIAPSDLRNTNGQRKEKRSRAYASRAHCASLYY